MKRLCLALTVLAAMTASAPAAHAYSVTKWPGGKVTYWNGAKQHAWAVAQAAKAWNRSGARVRLIATSKSRARLKIRYFPGRAHDGVSAQPGRAILGWAPRPWMLLDRQKDPKKNRFLMAAVVAHEFGHVLGFDHFDRSCSVMNTSVDLESGVGNTCKAPPASKWHCGLLFARDARAVARMYGGRARTRPPEYCFRYGVPGQIQDLAARIVGGKVALTWKNPAAEGQPSVVVRAGVGACPQRPGDGREVLEDPDFRFEPGARRSFGDLIETTATNSVCYAVFVVDGGGRHKPPVTTTITVPGVPDPYAEPSDPYSDPYDPYTDPGDSARGTQPVDPYEYEDEEY